MNHPDSSCSHNRQYMLKDTVLTCCSEIHLSVKKRKTMSEKQSVEVATVTKKKNKCLHTNKTCVDSAS